MKRIDASAPGKLMVSGEYAVLDGAVAIVASADVRVQVRWVDQEAALPPEAAATRELAERELGAVRGWLTLDASDLRKAGKKLGLGSSAAASAAVAGAILATHGHNLANTEVQQRAFKLALAGHKAIAPEGSGADVAAASLGGFVRFRLSGKDVEAARVEFPTQVQSRVVWTGKEARTSEFVRAVRAYEARDGQGFAKLRGELQDQALRFANAIQASQIAEIIAATAAYGQAMGSLGRAAGVPIVTEELAHIAALAGEHAGAAKPSGAGGGDVAIAFFPDATAAGAFDEACRAAKLDLLDLRLGAPGVRAE